jgi:hypothetical protein
MGGSLLARFAPTLPGSPSYCIANACSCQTVIYGHEYVDPKPPDTAPLVKLRDHLQTAREQGEAFEDVWSPAVAVALEGLRGADRREWVTALARTRETWQACYARRKHGEWNSSSRSCARGARWRREDRLCW